LSWLIVTLPYWPRCSQGRHVELWTVSGTVYRYDALQRKLFSNLQSQEFFFSPKKSQSNARSVLEHCHFPYNENPTRALNTASLKCCLPSTDVIDRWGKIHACVWRFKVGSSKPITLKLTKFSQKNKVRYFPNRMVYNEHNSPPRTRACQSTGGLTSTCLQTKEKDDAASLAVTLVEYPVVVI
jgi:hypothetical protein